MSRLNRPPIAILMCSQKVLVPVILYAGILRQSHVLDEAKYLLAIVL